MRRPSATTIVSLIAVGSVAGFCFWQLHPGLIFSNTTTAGGDTGAHVDLPAFLRNHLLAHGRLTGWSPDWYDGYPTLTFYFPLPSLLIALLSFVIPFNIAFKLVTVLGTLALPGAAWAFGRLIGARDPVPACLAVATLPYLFDQSYTIDGGNIASTLAGEFAFSISLALALIFLGVFARGLRDGRHRALAAGLLALTALCHMIPTIFAAVGAIVLLLMAPSWARLRWAVPVGVVGAAITGFWSLPFGLRQQYTTDMGWQKVVTYAHSLFPSSQRWVLVLAAVGVVASVAFRRRVGLFLTVMAVVSGLGFRFTPQGKLYNARILPFWVLCLYLLAGVGVAELGSLAARGWRRLVAAPSPASRPPPGAIVTPLVALAAAIGVVGLSLIDLPSWFPATPARSVVPTWAQWNYSGYEAKASYPEYRSLISTMQRVGAQQGCGRAMWEYEPQLDRLGTPMALMLLPYWTNGCIDSMEGLLFESSATTPYHFVDQAELSSNPSDAMQGLPYGPLDVADGVKHLQLLGVRYYMAISPAAEAQADADPDLTLVATSGPWPVTYDTTRAERTWRIYRVRDSAVVTPLTEQPVVLTGLAQGSKPWLNASLAWYSDSSRWDVEEAQSGPPNWARMSVHAAVPPRTPVDPARVSHVVTTDNGVSFDVDRVGAPVLVRISYFPNWQASGASGPWRVAPNLMVVVPTAHHVSLHYGYTPVDLLGWLLTLAGLCGLVLLWLRRPVDVTGGAVVGTSPLVDVGGTVGSVPVMGRLDEVFKAYDVRGTAPGQLDADICRAVGWSFARFSRASRILVARDMRESGIELSAAFIEGATAAGCDVVDLGLASTDLLYFASGRLDAPGAMFTASHNPAGYNGIKMCLSGARPVGQDTGLHEIKAMAEEVLEAGAVPAAGSFGSTTSMDLLQEYAAHVRGFIDAGALRTLRVVADTANGMGGLVVPHVMGPLGLDLEILYPELDGRFPNHPADPIQPENLAALRARVLETKADIGLAFDGDADRVFLVDERAEPMSGSLTTAVVAKAMLDKHPGATILYNLICSKAVPEVIAENGGNGVKTRVGHSFIKAVMAETGAVFGGEHSGHYYFRDNYRADSGLIAALIVLELMSRADLPLSELRRPFERYYDSGEINTEVANPGAVVDAVSTEYEKLPGATLERLDGLTVDLGEWWFNLRPSNTEPLLRLNLEAASRHQCESRVEEVLATVRRVSPPERDRTAVSSPQVH